MRSLILLYLALLFFTGTTHAQTQQTDLNYGLAFTSHEASTDHRTSLNLNPENPFDFREDFEIRFNLAFQRLTNAYGYVLRIVANDSLNIDLVSSPEHEEFRDLNLIINKKPSSLHFEFSDVELKALQWTTISLAFSHRKNEISLSWNGKQKKQSFSMQKLTRFRFLFGVNDFGKFTTTDAPPVIIKNIELRKNNELIHKWLLKKHHITETFDSIDNARAVVKNAVWLIDRHTKWAHRKTFTMGRFPSIAFNNKTGVLYATDERSIYLYDPAKAEVEKRKIKGGHPIHTDANQLVYIPEKNQLINYDVFANKVISYDFKSDTWSNQDTTYNEPNYWHNNKFYNPIDSSIYTFGGYGHFTYKNGFFRYDREAARWQKIKTTDSIPPRYLAASGIWPSKNKVLIFGGYGSMSGKQELSPQSFYDLYSFDLKNHAVVKLQDFDSGHTAEDMVFSNSLVVDEDNNCFYVLSFPKNKYETTIKLRQYFLDRPESNVLADSIPFHFHDVHSFSNLFLSEATQELIAVTVHKEKEHFQVHVYSISYPPLQSQDVIQTSEVSGVMSSAVAFVIIGFGLAGVAVVIYWRTREKTPDAVREVIQPQPGVAQSSFAHVLEDHKAVSSVMLFGGFQVFDRTGHDISGKFTMTLRELFTLILLHSVKFEKGISTTELQEYLWPDKDEVSARNNRNVNIKKLRSLLEEIGEISIENNNSYLRLNMGESVSCDYQTVYRILNHEKAAATPSSHEWIDVILKNVKRGSLLPNLQTNWLDNFKSDISNQVIDTLLEYSQKLDARKDDKVLLEIADAIFNYDTINQEALVIKCSVLNKRGKYSLAKTWYDHFVKEYKNLYSENYPKTFEDVIS